MTRPPQPLLFALSVLAGLVALVILAGFAVVGWGFERVGRMWERWE